MGKLIVIEGADGSGKGTQVTMLHTHLHNLDRSVVKFDFPQYKTKRIGAFIGEQLAGKHGDFRNMSPYIAALSYSLDRATQKDAIRAASSKGGIVLFDRYTESNLAFQGAKIADLGERAKFIEFVETVEYTELGIPPATLVIYLAVPAEISSELIQKKSARSYLDGKVKDQYEADLEYQKLVAGVYRDLARSRKHWRVVECARNGVMRTPWNIHKEILKIVEVHIGGNDIML